MSGRTLAIGDIHGCDVALEKLLRALSIAPNDTVIVLGDAIDRGPGSKQVVERLLQLAKECRLVFILGNHEKRLPDVALLRRTLAEAGLTNLGGRSEWLTINGFELLLAGTELPWFGAAPVLPRLSPSHSAFRILLSHTPDQLPWAKAHGFDLMLAGHLHRGYTGDIRTHHVGIQRAILVAQAGTATSHRVRNEANSYNVIRLSPQRLGFSLRVWDGKGFHEARFVEYVNSGSDWQPTPGRDSSGGLD